MGGLPVDQLKPPDKMNVRCGCAKDRVDKKPKVAANIYAPKTIFGRENLACTLEVRPAIVSSTGRESNDRRRIARNLSDKRRDAEATSNRYHLISTPHKQQRYSWLRFNTGRTRKHCARRAISCNLTNDSPRSETILRVKHPANNGASLYHFE